jgi:uncharacterized protein (TIGR04222 family)
MKFFPFNLTGPVFLAFYLLLCAVLLLLLRWVYRTRESPEGTITPRLDDPYKIALLRDGPDEAVRIAMVSLFDRGLLTDENGVVQATSNGIAFAQRPIEKAVLGHFLRGRPEIDDVFTDRAVQSATARLRNELIAARLVFDPWKFDDNARLSPTAALYGFLLAVALIRAAWSGPPRAFLVIAIVILTFVVIRLYGGRMTALGRDTLDGLRALFRRLQRRAGELRAGGATSEPVLLAAVFGLEALPAHAFPSVTRVKPKRRDRRDNDSSDGGSSSCSSCRSGGDGSGGGCGGGGGGGCGGGE